MHVLLFRVFILLFVCSCHVISSPLSPIADTVDTARIVNGFAVDISEVPYQASLRRKVVSGWAHTCGAVIITTRGVLTAAHCVISYSATPSLLRISVGTSSRLSGGKSYDISSVVSHEEYSSSTLENDIALLVTTKTINFGQTVFSVAVADPSLEIPEGTKALVSGFGTTSYEGTSSSVLLAAQVNVVSQETCLRAYLRIAAITDGMICANASNPPRDACQGDSGGPLVSYNNLIGIVSWGEGCAESVYPGVYTRVSVYSDWIWKKLATADK